jgi:hypothetical protein
MDDRKKQILICALVGAGTAWLTYIVCFLITYEVYCTMLNEYYQSSCSASDFPAILFDQASLGTIPMIIGGTIGLMVGVINFKKRALQILITIVSGTIPGVLCGGCVFMIALM